ncbi:type III secretion system chaperone [Ramlibacter rhizophilus]|uniref:Type III secretion system chaperone n=1 Tax=Ramlibacter rhizophilus TaxID=1781167 RepID=A0A4Z0BPU3_9BURK|nr:type III secretion system chaperone [Ramlibacter rhizophilus]TFZ01313.1 hypothetical protein EZ242_07990 [Ramlibacter rhizophilus]
MHAPDFLHELAATLGLPALQPDAHGACSLRWRGVHLDLQASEATGQLCVTARVGHAVLSNRRTLCAGLLLANLYLTENGRPHAVMDPLGEQVGLCHALPLSDCSGAVLVDRVERLAIACRELRERLVAQQLIVA